MIYSYRLYFLIEFNVKRAFDLIETEVPGEHKLT